MTDIPEEARLTKPEIAGVCGRFARLKEQSKKPIGYNSLAEMAAVNQLRKAIPIITKQGYKQGVADANACAKMDEELIRKQAQKEATAYYAGMMKKAIVKVREKAYKQAQEGWELQDRLLAMTVLNQNAPKIVLTNDECGWNISYFPDPPSTEGELSVMKGNPLEVVRALDEILKGKDPS